MKSYQERVVDAQLERALRISPAVNIVGPRATGKTTTARRLARSELLLDPASPGELESISLSPRLGLEGERPRLLDEWQLVPALWSAVRREVDQSPDPGQFLLSGSAWPEDDAQRHSGAGRFVDVVMRPMSLYESGESSGRLPLGAAVAGEFNDAASGLTLDEVAGLVVRGGWPRWIGLEPDDASELIDAYIESLSQREFSLVGGPRRAPERFVQFIRAYASLTAHPVPLSTVANRLAEEGVNVGKDYPGLFHDFARRLFVVEDQPPWAPRRRSKTRLVATPKRHLVDPSLAASALGLSRRGLLADPETFGFLFESLVVRDLRVYAQAHRATVRHYRTKDGTAEIDAVVEWRDGRWIGVGVKLNIGQAERAAQRLAEVASAMDRPPAALLVVVPGGPVTELAEGVWLAPVGTLGP